MVAVNLMPWRKQLQRHRWLRYLLCFGGPLMLCVIASVMVTIRAQWQLSSHTALQRQWRHGSSTLHHRLQEISRQMQLRDSLEQKWKKLQHQQQCMEQWHQRFLQLAETLPDSLWLNEITWQSPWLKVTGFALHLSDIERWRQLLAGKTVYSQVLIQQVQQMDDETLQFVLQLAITDEDT
ncbi:PilN domain-containing protein [Enterobacteriaceae bacterium LUAb1]